MTCLLRILLSCAAALCASGCGGSNQDSPLDRARREGVIRLGFANEAPFAYRDPVSGELTGEAPALARRVMAALGVAQVEGVLTEFASLIPGLQAQRFDVIAAGMYVTPERCRQVLFSEPSYCVREALIVPRGNPQGLHGYPDLVGKAAQLGVVAGTAELGYAKAAGLPEDKLSVFPDAPSALEGLRAGRIQAFACTSLTAGDLLRKLPDGTLEPAEPFAGPEIDGKPVLGCGAFAFRRGDEALRDAFDRELAALLASPAHAELVAPFGFGSATGVQGATRKALCGEHAGR
jgi:polar amino acid transport system substrate-binding protein